MVSTVVVTAAPTVVEHLLNQREYAALAMDRCLGLMADARTAFLSATALENRTFGDDRKIATQAKKKQLQLYRQEIKQEAAIRLEREKIDADLLSLVSAETQKERLAAAELYACYACKIDDDFQTPDSAVQRKAALYAHLALSAFVA